MKDISLNRIQEMAIETAAYGVHPSGEYIYSFYTEQLQAFARLVAEHERDRCATLCDELDKKYWQETGELMSGYGDAIREMDRS